MQVNKQLLLQRHNRGMNNRTRLVWNKDIIECIVLRVSGSNFSNKSFVSSIAHLTIRLCSMLGEKRQAHFAT